MRRNLIETILGAVVLVASVVAPIYRERAILRRLGNRTSREGA